MSEPDSFLGKQIERFRIDRYIARGAMGMVFEAHDTTLDRKVAIKVVLKDEEGGPSPEHVRKRFVQEAKIAGRLSHPNIVTVHTYGETDDLQYICMEYVEGKTLSQLLKRRKVLNPEMAFLLFEQILSALETAHQMEIVHRDMKPANIMVTPSGRVKIMDFGIAKTPALSLTASGTILGTPYYMSPEQISGRPVDTRSDIFSAGAVLYQTLTGYRPFDGETTSTLMYTIGHTEPIPPRDLNEAIPPALCKVIGKAMAKDPDKRYQSPSEMLQDLRNAMQKESLPEPTPATTWRSTGIDDGPQETGKVQEPPGGMDSLAGKEESREAEAPPPPASSPEAAHCIAKKKSSRRRSVVVLCVLLIAGAGAVTFQQYLNPAFDIRSGSSALQRINTRIYDYLAPIADGILSWIPFRPASTGLSTRLAGTYSVEGFNPDGTKYRGTAVISPTVERYVVTWYVANRVFSGSGDLEGKALSISWKDAGGRTGAIVYTLGPGGILKASWADGWGREILTPLR